MQNWFEDLWSTISGWITSGINGLWTIISGTFTWLWSGFVELSYYIRDTVFQAISGVWANVQGAFSAVWTAISSSFTWLWSSFVEVSYYIRGTVFEAVGNVWAGIQGAFTSFSNSVSTFFSDMWGKVSAGFTSLVTSLSSFFGDLWAKISTGLSNAATSLVNGLSVAVGTIAGYVQDAIAGALGAVTEGLKTTLGWIWTQVSSIAQTIVMAIGDVVARVSGFFTDLTRGMMEQATAIFSPGSPPEEDEKAAEEMFTSMIKSLEQMTKVEKKSPIAYEALVPAVAATVGRFMVLKLSVEALAAAADAAHPIKELKAHQIAAGMMGILDLPSVVGPVLFEPVRQGLLIPWQQYWASRYTPQIPGPLDLIRFVVREVIKVGVFNLNMALQGFSAEISGWYWEAHWILPSFGDLRQSWWRGTIHDDQFNAYIVLHDYKPEPRKEGWVSDQAMIAALSYELPGRIDARWMFEQGVIDTDTHLKLTKAQGMHPDWAPRVVEAEERASIRAELEASIRENAAVYAAGRWTEDEFEAMIAKLELGTKLTGFWVARASAMRARKLWLEHLEALDYSYRYDILTQDDYESELGTLAVIPDVIAEKVVNQNLRKKGPPPPSPALDDRLRKAQVDYSVQLEKVERLTDDVTEFEAYMTETVAVYNARISAVKVSLAVETRPEQIAKLESQLAILEAQKTASMTGMAATLTSKESAVTEAGIKVDYLKEMVSLLKGKVSA